MPKTYRLEWRSNDNAPWNPLCDPELGTEHIADDDPAVALRAFGRAVLDNRADINPGEEYRITVEEDDDGAEAAQEPTGAAEAPSPGPDWRLRLHAAGRGDIPPGRTVCDLESLRDFKAYVVIAPADSGMSGLFVTERLTDPNMAKAHSMSCRDFICVQPHRVRSNEMWRSTTYFLDGFEELRTDADGRRLAGDPRPAMDRLQAAISALEPSRVRLLTTPEAWLGKDDETHLARVMPGKTLVVATFEPSPAK